MTSPKFSPAENGVLAGVKVVEFAQNAAVPQCARLLAGMGADVVKVEPPTGDAMRHLAPLTGHESRAYATINPGKRAICLDLTAESSRPVADRLVQWADVALMGFKRTDLERFGLHWERVHELNPTLVSLEFTAYGPKGPEADQPGYDMLIQVFSGLGFSMNRTNDGVPLPTRPAFVDFSSGAMACVGVVAALRHRDRTGVGERVDASLLGTALSLGTPMFQRFEQDAEGLEQLREELDLLRQAGTGFVEQRAHYETRVNSGFLFRVYVRPYRTADGLISISGFSPGLIARFHELTGLEQLPLSTQPGTPEFDRVVGAAEALFATKSTAEWLEALQQVGYPCARFNTPDEAVGEVQAIANDYVVDLDHPDFGGYRTIGMPFSFGTAPVGVSTPSPRLGEHTHQVLSELGMSDDEITTLNDTGVVGTDAE